MEASDLQWRASTGVIEAWLVVSSDQEHPCAMLDLVKALFTRSRADPVAADGYGQSLVEDLRSLRRFLRMRQVRVDWRRPSPDERASWDAHPIVGRFGDDTYAVAEVGGRRWVVRDRPWFGWPDPPEFAWFVLEGERIWAAKDFAVWPQSWRLAPAD